MTNLLHELVEHSAETGPERCALVQGKNEVTYGDLAGRMHALAAGLMGAGCSRDTRVAIWLDKRIETVLAMFAISRAAGVFVPVNPVLKEEQIVHILNDCEVRILVTSAERAARLPDLATRCPSVRTLVLVDGSAQGGPAGVESLDWADLLAAPPVPLPRRIDHDLAAILYTSGSTGRPKGVVLSHRNMVAGAHSVASYLGNTPGDRVLALLPLSFDAGFSQVSTSFHVGATCVLMNYLLPQEVPRLVARHRITGLGAVPPVWIPLARLEWPAEAVAGLRYITNTGGAMPLATLQQLRTKLTRTRVFLMYGLTEAFRSTYLDPDELDRRPDSIGKAIPNAEILVVRPDGSECAADEPGELVHRGALVAQGYWNDPEKTATRYKPTPGRPAGIVNPELAVWSGDTVRRDAEGFLYFVGRSDDMIKTSGYRVSPTDVEEALYASGMVAEAAALGVPDPELGQTITVFVAPASPGEFTTEALLQACRDSLPAFMVPTRIEVMESLPRNPNGKIDRTHLKTLTASGSCAGG